MTEVIWIGAYRRRRPARPEKYRETHERLYDEVMFLQVADRYLEEELAGQIEQDLEERV